MSGLDDGVPTWWDRLNNDQRSPIKQAAQTKRLDEDGRRALADTGCPMSPTAIRYDDNPELAYVWPESLREFVIDQE